MHKCPLSPYRKQKADELFEQMDPNQVGGKPTARAWPITPLVPCGACDPPFVDTFLSLLHRLARFQCGVLLP
jgi:hypothetical protein